MSEKQELIEALLKDRSNAVSVVEQLEVQLLTIERPNTNQWYQIQRQRNALLEYKNAIVDRICDLRLQQQQATSQEVP